MDILDKVKIKLTKEETGKLTKEFVAGNKSEEKYIAKNANCTFARQYENLKFFLSNKQDKKENGEILIWVKGQYETMEELRTKFYIAKLAEELNPHDEDDE